MTIFDHLLRFDDEKSAIADPVVGTYYTPASDDGPGGWRGDVVIPNVSVYTLDANSNHVPYAGWFMVIALPAIDVGLRDGGECRIIADRDAALAGSVDFIRYKAADLTPADLATSFVEPLFAGNNYPFAQ